MSLFSTIETECPSCDVTSQHELVFSVNADRRPELRAEILDRTFQRLTCPACGDLFRIQPQFTYVHSGGHQFLTVWPSTDLDRWAEQEARSEKAFNRLWGSEADPVAAVIGSELVCRVVFGWEAAHEKVLAAELGVNDVTLELAKLALIRNDPDLLSDPATTLRLLGFEDDSMVLGMFDTESEHVTEVITVPRTLLDEIEADAESWEPLREQLSASTFVDMLRLIVEPKVRLIVEPEVRLIIEPEPLPA
jgi:CpXC protein